MFHESIVAVPLPVYIHELLIHISLNKCPKEVTFMNSKPSLSTELNIDFKSLKFCPKSLRVFSDLDQAMYAPFNSSEKWVSSESGLHKDIKNLSHCSCII